MRNTRARGEAASRALEVAEAVSPVDAVEAVTRELGAALGASAVSFLIADLSGRALVRLSHVALERSTADGGATSGDRRDVEESATLLPFDLGPVEQVLRDQQIQLLPPGQSYAGGVQSGQWTVLAPVTERGEVLGLLEMSLPVQPDPDTLAEIGRTAHLLGFVVIANRRHTDLFERGQRSTPFTLPAEIQRRL
ncbi:MAG: GAF domain-containing protein, partial [Actinomycetes bacterium]